MSPVQHLLSHSDSRDFRGRRVLHVTTVHPWDDTRIYRKECLGLRAAGLEIILAAPDAPPGQTPEGIPTIRFPKVRFRPLRMLAGPLLVAWAACHARPDILHLHDPELMPIGALLRWFGFRCVFDMHENLPAATLTKEWLSPRAARLLSNVVRVLESVFLKRLRHQ